MIYFYGQIEFVHRRKLKNRQKMETRFQTQRNPSSASSFWDGSNLPPLKIFIKNSQAIKKIFFYHSDRKIMTQLFWDIFDVQPCVQKQCESLSAKITVQKVSDTKSWLAWYRPEKKDYIYKFSKWSRCWAIKPCLICSTLRAFYTRRNFCFTLYDF